MKNIHFSDSESEGHPPKHRKGPEDTAEMERKKLPMYKCRKSVLEAVFDSRVTVIVGETGSGKSTQLPQLMYNRAPSQRIVVTQPRRVAAMSLAKRVSQEVGQPVGALVGYQVRFQVKSSHETRIKYVTDGILLRERMIDPKLRKYTTIVIDEAHERTIVTDLLLGLIKKLLQERKDLRVVIMSATLDAERFANFFGARILYVPGKMYHVERFYLQSPIDNLVDSVVACVCQLNLAEKSGDILVFLPGQEDIEQANTQLQDLAPKLPTEAPRIWPVPLYAALPEKAQQMAFADTPRKHRKVVLATNIAETSLTISGVRYVIDGGLRKVKVYRSKLGLESLLPAPISQASAAQRMGRAGREAPGKCFRLYTEKTYQEMLPHTEPEIARVSVSGPILTLKNANVDDILDFDWLESPGKQAIANGLLQLYSLGALDDSGKITSLGKEMVTLPLDPPLAAVLVYSKRQDPEVLQAVIEIVACLCVQDMLITPPVAKRDDINSARANECPLAERYGDLYLLYGLYHLFVKLQRSEAKSWCRLVGVNYQATKTVKQVISQLCNYLKVSNAANHEAETELEFDSIIRCFLHGFASNTALGLQDRRYQTIVTSQPINIHPSSSFFSKRAPAIMYLEYVYTTKGYARIVSPVEVDWIHEAAPQLVARS